MANLLGREALPRHHLEDRARRTNADALAAPCAARFIRIAVRADDDLGVLAAPTDIQDADDLDVLARPHTTRAENTGRHVMADHGIARPLVAGAQRQVACHDRGWDDVVLDQVALELVARMLAASVAEVLGGVTLRQQAKDARSEEHT